MLLCLWEEGGGCGCCGRAKRGVGKGESFVFLEDGGWGVGAGVVMVGCGGGWCWLVCGVWWACSCDFNCLCI